MYMCKLHVIDFIKCHKTCINILVLVEYEMYFKSFDQIDYFDFEGKKW